MSFRSKQQKQSLKNRKLLASLTKTRDSSSQKQKSYSKKQSSSIMIAQTLTSQSTIQIHQIQQTLDSSLQTKAKQPFDKQYLEKYYKKNKEEFPNISIIQQKDSILSNNLQNSLDSLSNFIIQGNKEQEPSSEQKLGEQNESMEDWDFLQEQYRKVHQFGSQQLSRESEYLQIISQLLNEKQDKAQNAAESIFPLLNVTQQIRNLKDQITKLKQISKKNSKFQQISSLLLENIAVSHSDNHEQKYSFNQKSLQFKTSNDFIRKELSNLLHHRQTRKFPFTNDSIQSRLEFSNKLNTSDRLLQHLSEEDKFIQEEGPSAQDEQTQKDQQQFMKFMDKKYSEENQPNLSLNNISKIMGVRPKEPHNKSIENQTQAKEKDDDEVVAMLQNQLRGKQRGIPEIPQTQENQILLKQSRENLCLNQLDGDIQNNIQNSLIQSDETPDENKKNFIIALQAREKWINSLEKEEKWKNAELTLLSKMKKILHNPYIEFAQY